MMARRDPETNILRNTLAAFAAGVGGADSVSVLPHTLANGLPDAFARRVARNTQVILVHESHLDFVADPAAGSGGIEALTDGSARRHGGNSRRSKAKAGSWPSLSAGTFQKRVAAVRAAREAAIRAGNRPIVGTTLYPAEEERHAGILEQREPTTAEAARLGTRAGAGAARRSARRRERMSRIPDFTEGRLGKALACRRTGSRRHLGDA